ncbi:GerAB/ArcD/ProY family transporter [Lysinibacillus halotolerans]|uniref:Spore gernimation protein n=1 Tax=Lysinibacillus halotolerans TaxID=1368476 RepID=A0A3M8H5X6_9BACI|nr:endospore germination permease [Lysinibacillus halotolerans]RNC97793.1 spore gernimation protein [Lysinibacillus halotolerans]
MQSLTKVLLPRQLLLMLILSTGLLNHVILIPNLLSAAGRDSWVSVIITYPICILFLILITYILNNSPQDGFFSLIKKRMGKTFSIFLSIPVVLYLFFSTYVTFRDLVIWLNAYFLAESSFLMITVLLIIACCIVTLVGIKNMSITSGLLLPLVIIFGIFISITNTPSKDPSLLFPIFTDGVSPIIKGSIYVLSALLEVYVIVLLQPYVQAPIKFKHLFVLITIFTILIFGPLTASLMEFGLTESVNFRYPAYEQWRILSIGEYISHLDFFALYQWLSGAVIRIGLHMYLLCTFFAKTRHYRLNYKPVLVLYIVLFAVMMIKVQSQHFFEFVYKYYFPICFIFFTFQILFSAFYIFVTKKRVEQHDKHIKFQQNK